MTPSLKRQCHDRVAKIAIGLLLILVNVGFFKSLNKDFDEARRNSVNCLVQLTGIEFDVVGDFAGGNINLYGIVSLDQRIGITDGATVVGNNEWYTLGTQLGLADLAQFVLKVERKISN